MKAPGISMPCMPLKQGVAPEWDLKYLCSLLVQYMEPLTPAWRSKIQSLSEKPFSRKPVPLYQLVLNISWITHPGTGACMCFWKFCMRFVPERSYRMWYQYSSTNIQISEYTHVMWEVWVPSFLCSGEFKPMSSGRWPGKQEYLRKEDTEKIFPACPGKGGRGDCEIHGERKWLSSLSQTTQWGWWFEFIYLDNFWDF